MTKLKFAAQTLWALASFAAPTTTALGQWVEQGPGPIIMGQDIGLTNPTNPV